MFQKPTFIDRISSGQDLLRVLVTFAAVLAVMAVLTMIFGVNNDGPSYQLIADPARGLSILP